MAIAKHADGSRWIYTEADPGPMPTKLDGTPLHPNHPDTVRWRERVERIAEVRRKIHAIRPHPRKKSAPRVETIEQYANRVARSNPLPGVGLLPCNCGRPRKLCMCAGTERLPDDDDGTQT